MFLTMGQPRMTKKSSAHTGLRMAQRGWSKANLGVSVRRGAVYIDSVVKARIYEGRLLQLKSASCATRWKFGYCYFP